MHPPFEPLKAQFRRTDDGCLIALNASRTKEGYSRCNRWRFGERVYLRHRLAWIDAHGELPPPGKVILHTCGRYACEEAEHLVLGVHPWKA
jgi:hypothetical protein